MTEKGPIWPDGGDNSPVRPMQSLNGSGPSSLGRATAHSNTDNVGNGVRGRVHCQFMATATRRNGTPGHNTHHSTSKSVEQPITTNRKSTSDTITIGGYQHLVPRYHSTRTTLIHRSSVFPDGQHVAHPGPGQGKSRHPQTNSPGGEGRDSNSITTLETSRIVSRNTKRGWIPLSLPKCCHTTKGLRTEKEETTGHKREVSQLDQKRKGETAKVGVARVGNYPRKEDVNRRPTTTVRAHNWQRLLLGRHLVGNLANNSRKIEPQRSQRVIIIQTCTPNKTNSSLDDNQVTRTGEWKKLKIVLPKTANLKTANQGPHASTNAEELVDTSRQGTETRKDQEEEFALMAWEPQSPNQQA
ncbi:unnamed protein product [Lactuca virosa]|uniref:Uncharacterized protein n=1 Tax=Lactuca virosa TaxID=75947 RepID=A0AAU9PQ64_9ASTR|nr:unnamed protein product [Lactuca virosa]